MTILIAPDSLKGSLSAEEARAALERGARRALGDSVRCISIPLADGGEGTVNALLRSVGGAMQTTAVQGPLGETVRAQWAILSDGSAAIEMAQASGLTLVDPHKRDAKNASSYGTGELIGAALQAGHRKIFVGIGGSATTDGGTGALRALGTRFLDANGHELPSGGAALQQLETIDLSGLDARLGNCSLTVQCDVTNPLCRENGAARIYGPQKGASPEDVEILDAALARFADVTARTMGNDFREVPGAGAAGGMGFGLLSYLGAVLRSGIEVILEASQFDQLLESADLVLTAEGSIDQQTMSGKTIAGVTCQAKAAKNGAGVPVIAFGGAVTLSGRQLDELGLLSAFPIADAPLCLDQCIERADELLANAAERALRLWRK
jgi:glycerate kinase